MGYSVDEINTIRTKCMVSIEFLQKELRIMYTSIKRSNDEWYNKHAHELQQLKLRETFAYILKYLVFCFSIFVLKVDREFLDFSSFVKKKRNGPKDAVELVYGIANMLDKTIHTLNHVRDRITEDETQLLLFYKGLTSINDYNFWHVLYKTLERMDVKLEYRLEDRHFFFNEPENKSYTPDRIIEKGLFEILEKP